MIVDIVDKYLTDDNNPIKNLRLKMRNSQSLCYLSNKCHSNHPRDPWKVALALYEFT